MLPVKKEANTTWELTLRRSVHSSTIFHEPMNPYTNDGWLFALRNRNLPPIERRRLRPIMQKFNQQDGSHTAAHSCNHYCDTKRTSVHITTTVGSPHAIKIKRSTATPTISISSIEHMPQDVHERATQLRWQCVLTNSNREHKPSASAGQVPKLNFEWTNGNCYGFSCYCLSRRSSTAKQSLHLPTTTTETNPTV